MRGVDAVLGAATGARMDTTYLLQLRQTVLHLDQVDESVSTTNPANLMSEHVLKTETLKVKVIGRPHKQKCATMRQ